MDRSTTELFHSLQVASDMHQYKKVNGENFLSDSPTQYLSHLLACKEIPLRTLCKNSDLGPYCYKIFSGDRKPSRNALLRIAYGLPMTLDEAQFALRLFGLARLDPRNLRDASLIFAFDRHFKLAQVQELLQKLEEEPL